MKTAKALGFKKGDFVYTGLFPGIVVQNVNTTTPMCEVWGLEHEIGSVYAQDLKKISAREFFGAVDIVANPPYTGEARKSIAQANKPKEDKVKGECPKCKRVYYRMRTENPADTFGNCGDCLIDHVEIVAIKEVK